MPQFDPAIFSPLLVWLVVTFVALYVLMSKFALPKVAAIIDQRAERIEGNLAKAEQLSAEAAGVLAAYEKAIADAQGRRRRPSSAKAAAEIAADTAQARSRIRPSAWREQTTVPPKAASRRPRPRRWPRSSRSPPISQPASPAS